MRRKAGALPTFGRRTAFSPREPRREKGFDVGFTYENIFDGGLGSVATEFNRHPGLNDSGCCFGEFTSLTFSRTDAQSFSLREIDFGGTTASYFGEVSFTPFGANGALDDSRTRRQEVAVAPANVVLTGVKRDGTEISALVNSYFNSDFIGGIGGPDVSFENAAPFVLDDALARTLSNLAVLDLTVGGAYSLGLDRAAALEDILRTSLDITDGLDALFSEGFDQCFRTNQSVEDCTFEDFGRFSFFFETDRLGNFGSRVGFDSFTFEDDATVAPVPLPASAPLLLAAVGFLAWRSKRKTRCAQAA